MSDAAPKYPLPPSMASRSQAKPMIRMITKMLPKAVKTRLLGRTHKITTDDVTIKHKKIKYW